MTISEESSILNDLDESDPELTNEIKEKLFSTATVLHIEDQDLQQVLRDFDDHELAILLKGKDDEFQDKILLNVSERRRMLIGEEKDYIGAVKKSEVDKTTREFLRYLQNMVDEGKVLLRRENDYYIE
jgi:flagellar motor switch protein FliG